MRPKTASEAAPTERQRGVDMTMFTNIARYFRAWKSYDKAMHELSSLTDRELADIGIYRCDIPRLAREHSRGHYTIRQRARVLERWPVALGEDT
jgi:uncharacterized protein YjiS (DUF1127 family)